MSEDTVINCPSCGQAYRMSMEKLAKYAGRTMTCKKCQQPFVVPEAEAEAVHEEAAAEEETVVVHANSHEGEPHTEGHEGYGEAQESHVPPPVPPMHEPAYAAQPSYVAPPATPMRPSGVRPGSAGGASFGNLVSFEGLLPRSVAQILFFVSGGVSVAYGLMTIFYSVSSVPVHLGGSSTVTVHWLGILGGLLWIVWGPIVARACCEILTERNSSAPRPIVVGIQ